MNLVVNARDAMPEGGRLTIATQNAELDEEDMSRSTCPVTRGRYILLTVEDTGMGMTPAIREQIFEPFFTTKEPGKGTGLGLSTVYGIVKQSGGNICVESEEGQGTTFRVYLPRLDSDEAVPEPELESQDGGADCEDCSETVLVVEDDAAVRTLTCKVLERHGYRVLSAVNGADALRLAAVYPEPIDLVVTDVVMPELGGTELAEQLRRTRPEVVVLFMSGYTEDELVRRGVADGRMLLLEKPFSPATLNRRVREALARGV
jgi:CheY-like chemotaxis protein